MPLKSQPANGRLAFYFRFSRSPNSPNFLTGFLSLYLSKKVIHKRKESIGWIFFLFFFLWGISLLKWVFKLLLFFFSRNEWKFGKWGLQVQNLRQLAQPELNLKGFLDLWWKVAFVFVCGVILGLWSRDLFVLFLQWIWCGFSVLQISKARRCKCRLDIWRGPNLWAEARGVWRAEEEKMSSRSASGPLSLGKILVLI